MITKNDIAKDLTHKFGGNGLAVVQFLPDEYCRVAYVKKDGLQSQVLTAWTKLLEPTRVTVYEPSDRQRKHGKSVEVMLTPVQFNAAKQLSEDLLSGKLTGKNTRIVSV